MVFAFITLLKSNKKRLAECQRPAQAGHLRQIITKVNTSRKLLLYIHISMLIYSSWRSMCDMFLLDSTLSRAAQSRPRTRWATCSGYWTKQINTPRPHKASNNKSHHMSVFNQCKVKQMHMTRLRMAKGRSVHGSWKKEKWRCISSFDSLTRSIRLGAVGIVWCVVFYISISSL